MSKTFVKFFILNIFLLFTATLYAKNQIVTFPKLNALLVSVSINDQPKDGYYLCYVDKSNRVWIEGYHLDHWGFPANDQPPLVNNNQRYFQLDWYQGVGYVIDRQALHLQINTPHSWFPVTNVSQNRPLNGKFRPNHPGLFLNYDLTNQQNNVDKLSRIAGITEMGGFNHYGVGTSSFLVNGFNYFTEKTGLTRLNTTWTLDQPENIASWRFGDSINNGLVWSGATRFAGIQYATNFDTQPNLVTFPLPGFLGEAVVPSTVDVLVNNSLRYQQNINRGAFYVNNIPVITGAGNMQIVTRDLVGREQIAVLPYYASENMLKSDLKRFSYEVGSIRRNFGINSNDYGRFLAVGTYAVGITDKYTAGVHGELLTDQQTVGFVNNVLLKNYSVLSIGGAASHDNQGLGGLASLGFRRQTPFLSYGFKTTFATQDYTQIGTLNNQIFPSFTMQSFVGLSTERLGSIAATFTNVSNAYNYQKESPYQILVPDAKILTLSYSKTVFKHLYATIGGFRNFTDSNNNQIFLTIAMPIGNVSSLSVNGLQQSGNNQGNIQLNRNLPLGNGYGYRLIAATNGQPAAEADFALQNTLGLFGAKYSDFQGQRNYELDARGSVIHFGRQLFLARSVDQSFALVQVPGFENVDVYYRNQLIGKTNKKGSLYIPELLPYQENDIRIDPRNIPLNAAIPEVAQPVIPYYKSGALVKFAVQNNRNLLLTLVQKNGDPIPSGAQIYLENDPTVAYPVAYQGQAFLSGQLPNQLKGWAIWNKQRCNFALSFGDSAIISKKTTFCERVSQR